MPRIIHSAEFLLAVAKVLFSLGLFAIADWVFLSHYLLGHMPFFEKLSLHTALLTTIATGFIVFREASLVRHLPAVGLVYCVALLLEPLQTVVAVGRASPGTIAAFICIFGGVLINQRTKRLRGSSLIFFVFTIVQGIGVIGVAQYILGVADLGARGLFLALSPSTSIVLLLLSPLLYVHSAFNALDERVRANQATQDLALALFSLPIGIALLCLIPRLVPDVDTNSGELLLFLLAMSSVLGCWFLFYFGTYASEKEGEITSKLEAQAIKLQGFYEKQLQVQTEVAEEQKRFSSVLAHEIRTPLTTVLGLVDVIRLTKHEQVKQAELEDDLNQIAASASLLKDMVNSVLDYAKLKSGQLVLVKEEVNLASMLAEVEQIYQLRAKKSKINLSCVIGSDVPSVVPLDKVRLREVISNLIDNALKFTPAQGQVQIEAAYTREKGQAQLHISVSDTGVGMKANQLTRIFEPFKQASEGISRRYGGTGLGLSYSRELVQFMGGSIEVDSEPDKGARFTVLLPVDDIASHPSLAPSQATTAPNLTGMKILMVEDHPLNIEINTLLLSTLAVDVKSVETAEEALSLYQNPGQFDVVLMDVNLGHGMNGLDATRAIKERFGKHAAPVLALTAGTMDEELEHIKQAGMVGVIPKPIDLKTLQSKLANVKRGNAK